MAVDLAAGASAAIDPTKSDPDSRPKTQQARMFTQTTAPPSVSGLERPHRAGGSA